MTVPKKVKYIIFDFGGVLIDLGGKYTGNPANLAKIFNISEEKSMEIWKENKEKLLTGKETPKEFLTRINKSLGSFIDVSESYEIWKKSNRIEKHQINWGLLDYTKLLRGKYKIYILTDTVDLDDETSELFNLIVRHFDGIYESFKIGYKKTDEEAFLYILKKINAKPEECIIIDDFQGNIAVANRIGLKGIIYTTLYQLKKDLQFLI